ncbi:MAG: hypothetical protein Q7V58_09650 [Actinomycetota bacterium]|nr:hypothetical protein [Actinomycetota bacterium]
MALEWPPGTIEDIARGKPTPVISDEPDVTPAGQAALMQTIREVTRDMNPTLLDEFRAQIEAAGRKLRREAGM